MNEFKGTPGPWFVDGFGDVNDTPEINEETFCIAACRGVLNVERDMHNAKLIASAPDLLEALQNIVTTDAEVLKILTPEQREAANSALAKALGTNK